MFKGEVRPKITYVVFWWKLLCPPLEELLMKFEVVRDRLCTSKSKFAGARPQAL